MNRIKTIKCIGAAGVLFGGLFAASAVFAGGNGDGNIDEVAPLDETEIQEGYHRSYHDDDDDFRRRRRFHDDDDDFRRRRRHRRHYYHNETNLGVSDLTFNDLGSALEAEITITGMSGAEPVKVDIEAMADVSSACGLANTINSPLEVQSDGSQTFEQTELQAKELSVVIDTDDSSALATSLSDCAGRLQVQDVQYLDARVDVSQGDTVLTMLCTFKAPTADGEIADENVECVAF